MFRLGSLSAFVAVLALVFCLFITPAHVFAQSTGA